MVLYSPGLSTLSVGCAARNSSAFLRTVSTRNSASQARAALAMSIFSRWMGRRVHRYVFPSYGSHM